MLDRTKSKIRIAFNPRGNSKIRIREGVEVGLF